MFVLNYSTGSQNRESDRLGRIVGVWGSGADRAGRRWAAAGWLRLGAVARGGQRGRARLGLALLGGHAQHVLDLRELHARTARGLAAATLVLVDRGPAGVGDELGGAGAQQLLDGLRVG